MKPVKTTTGEKLNSSGESNLPEIGLAKAEGTAYGAALKYLTTNEAGDSGEREIGDYIVGYAIEEAEGLYHMKDGRLVWEEPTDFNCHLEIVVRSASDGRFLPGLKVRVRLLDPGRQVVLETTLPFLWHPWIHHYGANCQVPDAGQYILHVHIDAPDFPRHDRINGKRFQENVETEFDIKIKTGRKLSKAA